MKPIQLTPAEWRAVMYCIRNFTDANARDSTEMRMSGVENPKALFSAEEKIKAAKG